MQDVAGGMSLRTAMEERPTTVKAGDRKRSQNDIKIKQKLRGLRDHYPFTLWQHPAWTKRPQSNIKQRGGKQKQLKT